MDKFKCIVGAELVKLDQNGMTVKKNNKTFDILFEADEGGCCGFNDIETNLYIPVDGKEFPVITKISFEYDEEFNEYRGEHAVITFFGLDKKIAEVNSFSSSGSGCCYGATVKVVCKQLDIDEVLTEW